MRAIFCVPFALCMLGALVWADGGTLRFRKQAGPFDIALFSAPETLRAGGADLSVMVRTSAGQSSVLDADVRLRLVKQSAGEIQEILGPATHTHATNKMMYAATVNFPSAGNWRVEVQVKKAASSAEVSGNLEVLERLPPIVAYWPYFALVPLIVVLFVVNRWLRRKGRPSRIQ